MAMIFIPAKVGNEHVLAVLIVKGLGLNIRWENPTGALKDEWS
ncbi:MAG: hypothetical protein ABW007_06145 [Chitinophagaceae bacterium]